MPDFTTQHHMAMRFINSFKADVAGKLVADVGGGDGFMALHFANSGAEHVTLVEPMDGVITQEVENHLRIVRTDRVSAVQHGRDVVWCHHVLEHIEAPVDFLRTIRRSLSPTGWLWLAVPNMADHTVFSPGHINNFMAPQLIDVLRLADFGIKNCSMWAEGGQLRVRVQPAQSRDDLQYPEIMARRLKETGRCPSAIFEQWNW